MPEGMTKIEQRPDAHLLFILRNDVGLNLTISLQCKGQFGNVERQYFGNVFFKPTKIVETGHRTMLDNFRQASTKLALWQRRQQLWIYDHGFRLVEGANHVFTKRVIYRCFSTNRGIDMGEYRGRNLNKGHTTLITCCCKACHISNNTTT